MSICPDFYRREIQITPQGNMMSTTPQEQGYRGKEAKARVVNLLKEIKCKTHEMPAKSMTLFKRCGLKEEIE